MSRMSISAAASVSAEPASSMRLAGSGCISVDSSAGGLAQRGWREVAA